MKKFLKLTIICFLTSLLYNCNNESASSPELSFDIPTKEVHFTPDTCRANNWDIRDFKITFPKSYSINKNVTENYLELGSESEFLNLGSASLDLNMSLASDYSEKKIAIKNSDGYALHFDAVRDVVDDVIVEKVTQQLVTYYTRNSNATLYSKTPKQTLIINDLPTSYSGFTLYGIIDNKEVWSHNAIIYIPNPDDFKQSLFAMLEIRIDKEENYTSKDFLESDSYKILSSITFN